MVLIVNITLVGLTIGIKLSNLDPSHSYKESFRQSKIVYKICWVSLKTMLL